MSRKRAIVTIDPTALSRLLFPGGGVSIVGVRDMLTWGGNIQFAVEHESLQDVHEGDRLPIVEALLRTDELGRIHFERFVR